jgi:hypothetical protein
VARGRWAVAGLGTTLVAVLLLPAPEIAALPVVLGAWALCVPLVLRAER